LLAGNLAVPGQNGHHDRTSALRIHDAKRTELKWKGPASPNAPGISVRQNSYVGRLLDSGSDDSQRRVIAERPDPLLKLRDGMRCDERTHYFRHGPYAS
jgi:hypothetical protein